MLISRTKDLKIFLDRPKIAFVYFFDDFCQNITDTIDSFFAEKYDLNKIYLKVKVSSSPKIIEELELTTYPIIKVYNNKKVVEEIYCNSDNRLEILEKLYNSIV
jgi:hypothetical protein